MMKKESANTSVVSVRIPLSVAMKLQMDAMKRGVSVSKFLRPYLISIAGEGDEVEETIAAEVNYHLQQAEYLANVIKKVDQVKKEMSENEPETT